MRAPLRHRALCRWSLTGAASAALAAAALSPWWHMSVRGGPTWGLGVGNGGVRVWWLTGGRTVNPSSPRISFDLGGGQMFAGWGWRCAPNVWVPNAWIPAWMLVAPLVLGAGAAWAPLALRRSRRGGCEGCGYPLEGILPGAGRRAVCPECGREFRES